jgi:hypothetical protein
MTTLAAIGAFLSSYVGGVIVKLILDVFSAWLAQRSADQNAKEAGASAVRAKVNQQTVETQDAMDTVPRPSDDVVADRLRSGKF